MDFYAATVVNGIFLGMYYVLLALGLTIIFNIMKVFNFAHGEVYMVGCLLTFLFFRHFELNFGITVVIVLASVCIIGFVLERVFFRPLKGKLVGSLLVALGLTLLIAGISEAAFGGAFGFEDLSVPSIFKGIVTVGGVTLSMERIAVIVITAVIVIGLHFFLQNTRMGLAMRAVAQDEEVAALHGININLSSSVAFMISCGLAGIAALLLSPVFFVNPYLGMPAILKALIVVVLGGIGSFMGAIAGGLLLGFVEVFGVIVVGQFSQVLGFIIILLLLLFRPRGLMGRE